MAATSAGVSASTPLGEHVRVAADELLVDAAAHVVDRERMLVGGDLRVQHDLHEDVAELLGKMALGARLAGGRGGSPGADAGAAVASMASTAS
jgi:hypothetical protein